MMIITIIIITIVTITIIIITIATCVLMFLFVNEVVLSAFCIEGSSLRLRMRILITIIAMLWQELGGGLGVCPYVLLCVVFKSLYAHVD